MAFDLGHQTVGIVTATPVLDGFGNPVVTELMEKQTTESVVWVDGCLFEVWVQRLREEQQTTTTTSEPAHVYMPVTGDGRVVARDVTGNLVFVTVDTITSSKVLRYGKDYVMRGDAVLEVDIEGTPDHVFCYCQHQGG